MAIPIAYNVRSVFARPASALATTVGIGFTVAILVGALALAAGFQQALIRTGRDDNALVVRKSADSEISSGLARDAVDVIRAYPGIASGPDGHPLVSAEVVVLTNKPRLGQPRPAVNGCAVRSKCLRQWQRLGHRVSGSSLGILG